MQVSVAGGARPKAIIVIETDPVLGSLEGITAAVLSSFPCR
jgi:hypothetical protein